MGVISIVILLPLFITSAHSLHRLTDSAKTHFLHHSAEKYIKIEESAEKQRGNVSYGTPSSNRQTCGNVNFDVKKLVDMSGNDVVIKQPTAITIGHDGNLYIATVEGYIHKIDYDSDASVVQSMCSSEKFEDKKWKNKDGIIAQRAFLGIGLDPRDKVPRPYVSASTIGYHKRDMPISLSNQKAWSNGAIERFKPASDATRTRNPNQCLEHDKTIVQGLPVSNGAHSVNQVMFSQSGDLLVVVGGNTNMGLPNTNLGGIWESYYSASVLLVKLSKPGFNGIIPYTTPNNLRTAQPTGGYSDVDLFATGLRNPFGMSMSRAGNIYVVDNGPNEGNGDASTRCSEYNEMDASQGPEQRNVTGGGAVFGTGMNSATRQDKILWIKKGKFYGHPNLPRSKILGVDECAYIDPSTGKTPPPGKNSPPANYEHRLALVKSAATGILEYGGNEFCGKLRGTMIISMFPETGSFAVNMKSNGRTSGKPYKFNAVGGMSVAEDATGSLIFPIYSSKPTKGIYVFKPRVSRQSGLHISGAIPFRHGKKGGNQLHIAGRGFTSSSTVTVGGNNCPVVKQSATLMVCKVPPHRRGPLSVAINVMDGSESFTLRKAVLYMQK